MRPVIAISFILFICALISFEPVNQISISSYIRRDEDQYHDHLRHIQKLH